MIAGRHRGFGAALLASVAARRMTEIAAEHDLGRGRVEVIAPDPEPSPAAPIPDAAPSRQVRRAQARALLKRNP